MSSADTTFILVDVQPPHTKTPVSASGLDVFFPDHVRGWSDVLDARIAPYTERKLEDVCHFAEHVHKKFILVSEAQAK